MPKTTIPEKWLQPPNNHLTSRFEIPPAIAGANNEIETNSRAQRDSIKKTSKIRLNAINRRVR